MGHHQQMARPGLDRPVHQQQVAIAHAPGPQPLAPYPHEEGAQGVGNQQAVEVQAGGGFGTAARDGDGQRQVVQLEEKHASRKRTDVLLSCGLASCRVPRGLQKKPLR